jgi:HEAT repeat protein
LRNPDGETLHLLDHYLALGKDARDDPAALAYLASLVGAAPESLAINVLESLDRRSGIAPKLTEGSVSALVKAAVDTSRPDSVRRGVLLLIGRARIRRARAGITPLTQPGNEFRADALDTIGKLEGGLSVDLVARMLIDEDGNVRAVAVRYLRTEDATETLVRLATTDPAPRVRIVAVRRLLDEHGKDVLDDIATGLGDEDATVRMVVARNIAKLGDDVVPKLEALADSGSEREAEGVVLAFSIMGGDAGKALVRLHREHKSEKIRTLAGLALGYLPGGDSH